ncbi:hypothetical protein U1Q18_024459 [Sarracenia purpurea var. burkii]
MSSTLLEVTRAGHEEVERLESEKKMPSTLLEEVKRLERLIVKDLQTVPATSKDRLHQGHRVDIYEDKDNARKNEIAALGGQTVTGTNVDIAFYDRLKDNARKDENEIAALRGQTVSETNVLNAFYDRLKDNARKDEDEIAALGGQTVTETNVLNAFYDEIAALGGQTVTETNVFNAFYDRLKEIHDYHRQHPIARVVDINEEYEKLLKEEPHIEFTGEVVFLSLFLFVLGWVCLFI